MSVETHTYMICQGCETAVRECSDGPCPVCRRCGVCGRKLKEHEDHCGHDAESIEKTKARFGFPESELPRERRRIEIRKQLENRWRYIGLTIGLMIFFGGQFGWKAWIGVNTFGDILLGAVVVSSVLVTVWISWHWFLRHIETRRLATEFPTKSPK